VGEKPANAFGLRDMHGNVWEWCFDGYERDFYARSPLENPVCIGAGDSARVVRGGGCSLSARLARSATRSRYAPDARYHDVGLRLALGQSEFTAPNVPDGEISGRFDAKTTPSERDLTKSTELPSVPPASIPVPKPPAKEITNSIGMKLALIPAGGFLMGSSRALDPDAEDSEMANGEKHRVRITRPYYLAVTEVTQGQYRAVTNQSLSFFKGSDDLPVENVSWLDAVAFCNALSVKEDRPQFYRVNGQDVEVPDWNGKGYRLPTEAEWEYACRANNPARYSFGNDAALLKKYAWDKDNSDSRTHPVGEKPANAFGVRDMHGNVWEWCFDGYAQDFYTKSPVENPVCVAAEASGRAVRGGSWSSNAPYARSAYRARNTPVYRSSDVGLRPALGQ
jgi:formylglycine-generating enzyme required for sulfatase activity